MIFMTLPFRIVVAATLLASTAFCADTLIAEKSRKEAPVFTLKDAEGRTVRLADYRGKVVLLDFWATWCVPCKLEIPWFIDMQKQYQDRGFEVLGVSMDEKGWEVVKPFMAQMGVQYRVMIGNESLATTYSKLDSKLKANLDELPATFLIDRQGKVAAFHEGITGKDVFVQGVERLLAEPGNTK